MANPLSQHYEILIGSNSDADTVIFTFGVTADEQGLIGSRGLEYLALIPITTKEGPLAEVGTENFVFRVSTVSESQVINDINTEVLSLTGSFVEAQPIATDAATQKLVLVPITAETKARLLLDSATEKLTFTILVHECYQVATPEWLVLVHKRWDSVPLNRWTVTVEQRWSTAMLVGAVEVAC